MSSYLGICPKCKDDNVILSKPRGYEFVLLKLLPISVCRCQNCHHRFKKMSKLTTYIGNIVYLAIFCLIGYVLFSQYELNKDHDYLSNTNQSSVQSVKNSSAVKQESIIASVARKLRHQKVELLRKNQYLLNRIYLLLRLMKGETR